MGIQAISLQYREKDYDRAYQMAKEVCPDFSKVDEPHMAGMIGWILVRLIEREDQADRDSSVYRAELKNLPIKDELLEKAARRALGTPKLAKAALLMKEGREDEAEAMFNELLKAEPDNQDYQTSYGWLCQKKAYRCIKGERPDYKQAKQWLMRYLKLSKVFRPSTLHSAILLVAVLMASDKACEEFSMLGFLKLWDLDTFHMKDWYCVKDFPPLAAQAIFHAARDASNQSKEGKPLSADMASFIETKLLSQMDKAESSLKSKAEWFPLYRARISLWLGRRDEAVVLAIKLVQSKVGMAWTWDLLGDITVHDDVKKATAYFAKALTLTNEEPYHSRLRMKLARGLYAQKRWAEARYEGHTASVGLRRAHRPIPHDVKNWVRNPEFMAAPKLENNRACFHELIPMADAGIAEALEWMPALFGRWFTIPAENGGEGREAVSLYVKDPEGNVISVAVSKKQLGGFKTFPGTAVKVKGIWHDGHAFRFLQIDLRSDGERWDLIQPSLAVVTGDKSSEGYYVANTGVGKAEFISTKILDGLQLIEGDVVAIRKVMRCSAKGIVTDMVGVQRSDKRPEELIKTYRGEVRINTEKGFGIVTFPRSGAVFIFKDLLAQAGLQTGDTVEGIAVPSKTAFKALSARKVADAKTVTDDIDDDSIEDD